MRNCYPFWPQASYLRAKTSPSPKRDAASAFAPGGAKPTAAGVSDDNGDSEPEHVDNALAVSRFGGPASVAGAGASSAWWNSADTLGGTHGGVVGPSTDDDVVSQIWWKRGAWAA